MKRYANVIKRRFGFTLIEIIIVVVIMGILAAVALPRLSENINKAKAAEAFGMGSALHRAFERCLDNETVGSRVPTPADVGNCDSFLEINMIDPPTSNFVYNITPKGGPMNTVIIVDAKPGNSNPNRITFTLDGSDGTVVITCNGYMTKMCK